MRADIFVHPDFPMHVPEPTITTELLEYEGEIRSLIVGRASSAIRIRSIREDQDLLGIECLGSFVSGGFVKGEKSDSGVLGQLEFAELLSLIKDMGIDEAIIHGAYLGYCVRGFASQLKSSGLITDIKLGTVLRHPYEKLPKNAVFMEYVMGPLVADYTNIHELGLDAFGRPVSPWL